MPLLNDSVRSQVEKRFKELQNPVKIINFTQEIECQYCAETRQLMQEIAGLSDKLSFEVYNFVTDKEKAKRYNIDKIPATVILGDRDYGIRFFGIPSGYEFVSVLECIVMVSKRDSGLAAETKKKLTAFTKPLHLQVFVTPT
jgi:glutaredoxin-like protein